MAKNEKKSYLRIISLLLVALMLIVAVGCGKTPDQETKAPKTGEPVKGGTLRIIYVQGPQVVGYPPEQGPIDQSSVFPGVEKIMENTEERTLAPFLAESVGLDQSTKTVTIKLREGIMFHDGTELTADVAAWNYQLLKDTKKLPNGNNVSNIEVKDKYTVVLHLSNWYNKDLMEQDMGWVQMISKDAVEKNGKDWARNNVVGTGPFILEKFQRDVSISWVRNDNYWQKDKGLPYLDRIEGKFIPNATTAATMMQGGEADIWKDAPVKDLAAAESKGFMVQSAWAGRISNLIPNTVAVNSKWKDIRLRQALDYAIDKQAIAKAMGFGIYAPMDQYSTEGEWGHNPNYAGIRKYDPAKAKQLLTEAGYPNGLKIKLLAQMGAGGRNEAAEAIKGYLDAVGFQTEIDIADPGRFTSLTMKTGWEDLVFYNNAKGITNLVATYTWWSDTPKLRLAGYQAPQPLADLFHQAMNSTNVAEQKEYTKKILNYLTDEALFSPVFFSPGAGIMKPTVHTNWPKLGLGAWDFANTWIEKN